MNEHIATSIPHPIGVVKTLALPETGPLPMPVTYSITAMATQNCAISKISVYRSCVVYKWSISPTPQHRQP